MSATVYGDLRSVLTTGAGAVKTKSYLYSNYYYRINNRLNRTLFRFESRNIYKKPGGNEEEEEEKTIRLCAGNRARTSSESNWPL